MSLIQVVTRFCERTNLPAPSAVMASSDQQVIQVRGLLEEGAEDIAERSDWEGLTLEQEITTLAQEDQGAIAALTDQGFRNIKNQTIWDRTRHLPVAGPLDAREWQAMKALFANGPYYRFRIMGGHLLVNPIPPAGESWFFEYITKSWILDPDGVTMKQFFTNDADTTIMPESLVLLDLRWRWKCEKGLEYAEAKRTFEMRFKDAAGRDGGKPVLRMDNELRQSPQPGVFVSPGNWSLP